MTEAVKAVKLVNAQKVYAANNKIRGGGTQLQFWWFQQTFAT